MICKLALLVLLVPQTLLDSITESGRIVGLADSPSDRLSPTVMIAPGAPPILGFRYFDATDRARFGDLGLMTDDAGH